MTIIPGDAYHAGATFKTDNTILHYYLVHEPEKFQSAVHNEKTCARVFLDRVMKLVDDDDSESEGDDVDTDDLDSNYSPGGASESAGGGVRIAAAYEWYVHGRDVLARPAVPTHTAMGRGSQLSVYGAHCGR